MCVRRNLRLNNSEAVREAAPGGLGIALLPALAIGQNPLAQQLRVVLGDHEPVGTCDTHIFAHYLARPLVPPKVRAWVGFLRRILDRSSKRAARIARWR